MAQIDVTDILSDPDMIDEAILIHRTPFVDQYGENHLKEQGFPTFASIQPISGNTLQRIPEAFRVANVKSFWLKGKIVCDSRDKYPDIISVKGVRYAVQLVFDWANWGNGWSEGTCVQEHPTL